MSGVAIKTDAEYSGHIIAAKCLYNGTEWVKVLIDAEDYELIISGSLGCFSRNFADVKHKGYSVMFFARFLANAGNVLQMAVDAPAVVSIRRASKLADIVSELIAPEVRYLIENTYSPRLQEV